MNKKVVVIPGVGAEGAGAVGRAAVTTACLRDRLQRASMTGTVTSTSSK